MDAAKASVNILNNKYKNKYIILTGKKKIKVYNFLKILAKILKISEKIKFLNQKYTGHYTKKPTSLNEIHKVSELVRLKTCGISV